MKKFYVFFIIATAYLFGTTPAFAWRGARVYVKSNPSNGGYVWVTKTNGNAPSVWDKTEDSSEQSSSKVTSWSADFYLYANPISNYVFKGWANSDNTNTVVYTTQTNCKVSAQGNSLTSYSEYTYYAIFARLTANASGLTFEDCLMNATSESQTVTINHAHAGKVTAVISGTNASEFSVNKGTIVSSSISEGTASIEVVFVPTSSGDKSAMLIIKSDNGLSNIEIPLFGKGLSVTNPSYSSRIASTYYVGDQIDLDTLWTSTSNAAKAYSIVSFTPSSSINKDATEPAINGTMLTMNQAGTLKLKLAQSANTNYYAGEDTTTITIAKRPNPITITFNDATYASNTFNMPYGAGASVLVSTANEANTITIAQTAGADLATYYDDQHAVYTSYKSGTATWSVSQPENYKYLAGSANFAVNIAPAAEEDFTLITSEETLNTIETGKSYAIYCNAKTISFEAKKALLGVNNFHAQYSTDNGKNWSDYATPDLTDSYITYGPYEIPANTTHVRFCTTIGATFDKKIRNIRVDYDHTLTTSIESEEGLRVPDCRLGESKTATFNINWSRPSTSHNIHIEGDNAHFTLSQNVIDNVSCNHGSTAITVTYTPIEAGEETDTLTIYDESQVITLVVHGKVVDKFTPEIDWLVPTIVKPQTSFNGLSNIVTSNSASPLVITSSDETIATYDAATQTLQTYDKEGFVVFTVSQTANEDFHAITLQFSVLVTNKENQMCILYEDGSKHSLSDVANANVGEFDINLDAPVSMISADIWKTSSVATGSIVVKWYDENNTKLGEKEVGVEKLSTSAKNFVMQLPRDTRKIDFKVKGTLSKFVQNIKVYRAQYLEHNAVLTDGALDFGSDEYNAEPTIREFDILYSGAGEFSVSSSNNALFTVESVSETIDCANAWGTKHISIAYNHNTVSNEHTADLNVQLGTMFFSIPLVGTTNRPSEAIFIGNVDDDWKDPNNWLGGVTPADNADITIKGDLVINDGEERTVNSLVIESTGSVLVVSNGSLIVNGTGTSADGTYGDLTVNKNGSVIVKNSECLTVNNLIFEASPEDNKGAVISGSIKVAGSAYIDINMDKSGTLNDKQYYSFSVPFAVSHVERYNTATSAWESAASLYRAYSYSESIRATQGKTNACWKSATSFAPGVFYLIEFADSKANTYRFHWAGNADGILNSEPTALNVTSTGASDERGWNGIGNTGLTYASLSDVTIMQSLSEDGKSFESFTSTTPMAIGKAAFVQVAASGSVSWIQKSVPASVAARRVAAEENELFNLHIAPLESDIFADQIFLTTSEDAQPLYEIGRDVAKMSMGTAARAQMWIDAYGKKLVAYDALLQDEQATATLGFSAPKAGEYTVSLENDFGADVYLTYEDKKIANLSLSPYTISLNAGDNSGYGLLINRAARVTTDFMQTESQTLSAEKKLINGQLFILSAGHLFDAQGRMMK